MRPNRFAPVSRGPGRCKESTLRTFAIPEPTLRVPERAFLLRGTETGFPGNPRSEREQAALQAYLALLASGEVAPVASDHRYHDHVSELVASARPMAADCRVAINVPAFGEERVIARFLESYAGQDRGDGWSWELNVLVNTPAGAPFDATARRARAFGDAYAKQGVTLNVLTTELPRESATVGLARRLLSDFVLVRAGERLKPRGPLYVKHEDADTAGHSPRLLVSGVRALDEAPWLDAIVHRIAYDPVLLDAHDGLRLDRLLYLATERAFFRTMRDLRAAALAIGEPMAMSDRKFRVLTSGFSTLCSAESLALLCGGFSSISRSEDLQYGDKLALLRGRWNTTSIVPDPDTVATWDARSWSDARRPVRNLERALISGGLPDDPYADFADPEDAQAIRALDPARLLATGPLAEVADLASASDVRLTAFTDLVLDFCSRLVVKTVPGHEEEVLVRYRNFLCDLFAPGAVTVRDRRVVVRDIQALRSAPALTRLPVF